ncbi:hypothetical protein AAU61_15840 [Desulfocarbo indianensis]|nr:hypothetical protein AAU61_15840 [Desulfocarbo indianensis]
MGTLDEPREMDLAQVGWPFCLLEVKCALNAMAAGQVLRVRVSDPHVLGEMSRLLAASPDRVLETSDQGSHFLLTIKKG